jgi:hypothetical protein
MASSSLLDHDTKVPIAKLDGYARRSYPGLSQISGVDGSSGMAVNFAAPVQRDYMILNALVGRVTLTGHHGGDALGLARYLPRRW